MTSYSFKCNNFEPHLSHLVKTGFLGLRKVRCDGLPTEDELLKKPFVFKFDSQEERDAWFENYFTPISHKHFYRLNRVETDFFVLQFNCEICGAEEFIARSRWDKSLGIVNSFPEWYNNCQ